MASRDARRSTPRARGALGVDAGQRLLLRHVQRALVVDQVRLQAVRDARLPIQVDHLPPHQNRTG